MAFLDIFRKLGSLLSRALSIVRAVVPPEVLALAVAEAKKAVDKFDDNHSKREYVIAALKARFPFVPESVLRLAVELAVQVIKREAKEALDKV